jgi:hypothetical protein
MFEVPADRRAAIEQQWRPEGVQLDHPTHRRVLIRDQKPMSESALRTCLADMTTAEWYATLNRRAFLWASHDRVERLLGARAYRDESHTVLTIDSAPLVHRYAGEIELSPINSGSTIFNPQVRGSQTFTPLLKYPFEEWRRKRSAKLAVAEVTVPYAIRDIADFVIRVEERRGSECLRVLYER